MSAFAGLPEEIIENVFFYLSPDDLLVAQWTCKAFRDITNGPLLWRHHCRSQYKNWDRKHRFWDRLKLPAAETNWKQLFLQRRTVDKIVSDGMNQMLSTQRQRIPKIDKIAVQGEDARDALLRQRNVADDAEDVLARRYYSEVVLATMNRRLAVRLWSDMRGRQSYEPRMLESGLGAYDLFVLGPKDNIGTIDFPPRLLLDDLGNRYKTEHPDYVQYTTRARATTLAQFLRECGFTGVDDANYHNIRNNFIGIALEDEKHPALPLITVAIYCCVADRIGLDARPCGYPYHVYAIVYAPPGFDHDNKPVSNDSDAEAMYMDPFRSADEVPVSDLRSRLSAFGATPSSHATFLSSASVSEMILRTGRNIINAYREAHQQAGTFGMGQRASVDGLVSDNQPDLDASCYASLWATIILTGEDNGDDVAALTTRRRSYLAYLLQQFQVHFPEDIYLVAKYIIPLFHNTPQFEDLVQLLTAVQKGDAMKRPVRSRGDDAKDVKYRIGQVFEHKRYGYEAVIIGWDPICTMGEDWIEHMGVDRLDRGRHQSFYHVL